MWRIATHFLSDIHLNKPEKPITALKPDLTVTFPFPFFLYWSDSHIPVPFLSLLIWQSHSRSLSFFTDLTVTFPFPFFLYWSDSHIPVPFLSLLIWQSHSRSLSFFTDLTVTFPFPFFLYWSDSHIPVPFLSLLIWQHSCLTHHCWMKTTTFTGSVNNQSILHTLF